MTNSGQMKSVDWATWTCVAGSLSSDVGAACRSPDKSLLASSEHARIKLARFPYLDKCEQREFRGHSSSVQDLAFSATNANLLSVGGLDATVLQWKLVDAP